MTPLRPHYRDAHEEGHIENPRSDRDDRVTHKCRYVAAWKAKPQIDAAQKMAIRAEHVQEAWILSDLFNDPDQDVAIVSHIELIDQWSDQLDVLSRDAPFRQAVRNCLTVRPIERRCPMGGLDYPDRVTA